MTPKTSDPIDRRSLLRQIAVRIKWWGELDADEIIQMIKQAPKVGSEEQKDEPKRMVPTDEFV